MAINETEDMLAEAAHRQSSKDEFTIHMIMKVSKWIAIGFVVFFVFMGSWFTVDQTELGNVRRFGVVIYPKNAPLEPGLHLKIPFIDTADKTQVTLQTLHIPPFDVLTIDNQLVTIEENLNYTISRDQFYHVMYEVGRADDPSNNVQIVPVVHDRTARVFAAQNMVTVNADREAIQAKIEASVTSAVETLFGITAHSLQIAAIKPSDAFMHSIDEATLAKNAAIAAENQLRTREFEAKQAVATATGAADSAIESARGQAESVKLAAEAAKIRLELEGLGTKASLEAQIAPFGGAEKFIDYLRVKSTLAALNWNGQMPQIVSGSGSGTNLIVPLPSMGQARP